MPQNPTKRTDGSQPESTGFLLTSIEDNQHVFNTCPNATTMWAWSNHFKAHVVIALTCKRWGCRYCGTAKAKELGRKVKTAKPTKLITLTVNPARHESPRKAYESTTKQLPLLARVIRQSHEEFEYLRVLEVTKKGWPHFHLVARCPFIKQSYISNAWATLTGAPIVDIRQIKRQQDVAQYVMKYLCKQTYIPWTNRRVSWTRNFFPRKPKIRKGKWKMFSVEWYSQHPVEWIAHRFDGHRCCKVAADAWTFKPSE